MSVSVVRSEIQLSTDESHGSGTTQKENVRSCVSNCGGIASALAENCPLQSIGG
jgi:hypothetical protein